jgi:seryl-tRNA synthetase
LRTHPPGTLSQWTIIAIVENHQRQDGTVEVPVMLREFWVPATI